MPVKLLKEQYDEILRLQCPYCAAGLTAIRDSDRQMFVHSIPGTTNKFDCEANKIRGQFDVQKQDDFESFVAARKAQLGIA